jgi:hypothetical protein
MNIVKFDSSSTLPAYLLGDTSLLDINKEVVRPQGFPTLSIKGMKFTVSKEGVKTVLTKPDDADEVAQSIGVVFLRANMNAKTFYAKKYSEGDSERTRPDCYSFDGVAPSENADAPQAKKCAVCPHNQWGSRTGDGDREGGKGKACQDNARIAVSAPDKLDPMMLRVPPASLKNLRETLKMVAARKVPYNAVVIKVGFDREAPSPLLTFKPIGLLDDHGYQDVKEMYESEIVRGIVGLDDAGHADTVEKVAPRIAMDELDAAIAAREVTRKAADKPAKVVVDDLDELLAPKKATKPVVAADDEDEPAPVKAEKPKKAAKPVVAADDEDAPAPAKAEKHKSGGSSLLADLDDLLGNKDD